MVTFLAWDYKFRVDGLETSDALIGSIYCFWVSGVDFAAKLVGLYRF